MKKSKRVPATFIAGLAAAMMAGCSGSRPVARGCIDDFGNVVPDIECRQANSRGVVIGHYGVPGGGGYYGGGGGGGGVGVSSGRGGSTSSSTGSVSRGGFGDAGGGFGSGGFGGG